MRRRPRGSTIRPIEAARAKSLRLAGARGSTRCCKAANATVLVEPTYGAAWLSDPVYGDQYGGPSASELPAIAGYPHLTVPMGLVRGLPVGLSLHRDEMRRGDGAGRGLCAMNSAQGAGRAALSAERRCRARAGGRQLLPGIGEGDQRAVGRD